MADRHGRGRPLEWEVAPLIEHSAPRRLRLPGCGCCLGPLLKLALLAALVVGAYMWHRGLTPAAVDREVRQGWNYVIAAMEMQNLARQLRAYHLAQERFPADLDQFFAEALGKRRGRRGHPDPWGVPYELETSPDGFVLRCAGRDRRYRTPDDLVVESTVEQGSRSPHMERGRTRP